MESAVMSVDVSLRSEKRITVHYPTRTLTSPLELTAKIWKKMLYWTYSEVRVGLVFWGAIF
jgi:hypothetical protein